MMNVAFSVHVSDFPDGSSWAHLNTRRPRTVTFTWSDILRAAVVAGYPDLTQIPSRQLAQWRTAGLHLALRHFNGELIQPPESGNLDPSEKAAVSSLLGVVVTKLLVERFLRAPVFLYLDVYFHLSYPNDGEKIRPDFAALRVGHGWFSVEAKGRSRYRRATLDGGKRQARALGRVNGQPVLTGVVCVTSFRRGRMQAHFADPPPTPDKTYDLQINPMDALIRYYGQVTRFEAVAVPAEEVDPAIIGLEARLLRLPTLDLDFGILPELAAALEVRSFERSMLVLKNISERQSGANRNPYLGPDGIIVVPGRSWEKGG